MYIYGIEAGKEGEEHVKIGLSKWRKKYPFYASLDIEVNSYGLVVTAYILSFKTNCPFKYH